MVDVNVTTRNKVIEEQVFKDKKLIKAKNGVDWEKKERLKQSYGGNKSTNSENKNPDQR